MRQSNTNIFFIGGIHGVGKTTLCELIADFFDIPTFSASAIIKAHTNNNFLDKIAHEPESNQSILIKGLGRLRADHQDLILDGHFTIISGNGIYPISVNSFINMDLSALFLLTDTAERILKRRLTRDSNLCISLSEVENHLKAERRHAEAVSKVLGLPLHLLDVNNPNCSTKFKDILIEIFQPSPRQP
ncbi:ATP-binding protein [Pseudodesulfovibrio karagichevae]|uniref:ATP-binding protein n=1 Tax=Pseudodesulfovibrio karagichevae TaxID=3239305 RepID=A0ABV4K4W4_9BACT